MTTETRDPAGENDELSTEYLLQRRALGSQLSQEVQRKIEAALLSRGAVVPPMPVDDIDDEDIQSKT